MRALEFLYGTAPGRLLLRGLTRPWFSRLGGRVMDSRLSALAVPGFIRRHGIDMGGCPRDRFDSFNDFFTRRLAPGERPVDPDPDGLLSPCDGRLALWPIRPDGRFPVKGTAYTLEGLLRDGALAERFAGGTLWLFRLSPEDYHRYIWPADGERGPAVRIPGLYHTIQPLERGQRPVYHENTREYCLLATDRFGPMVMMEVGALLVGRIVNEPDEGPAVRGAEKGHFAFGGSTVILLTEKDAVLPRPDLAAAAGGEIFVRQGERVGTASRRSPPRA